MTVQQRKRIQTKLLVIGQIALLLGAIVFAPVAYEKQMDYLSALEHRRSLGTMFAAMQEIKTPVYITDENMDIKFCNVAAAKQAGYTRGELIGSNVSLLVPDRFLMKHRAGVELGIKQRKAHSSNVDCWLVKKNGSEIPVAVSFDLCVLNESMIYVARTPGREVEVPL